MFFPADGGNVDKCDLMNRAVFGCHQQNDRACGKTM